MNRFPVSIVGQEAYRKPDRKQCVENKCSVKFQKSYLRKHSVNIIELTKTVYFIILTVIFLHFTKIDVYLKESAMLFPAFLFEVLLFEFVLLAMFFFSRAWYSFDSIFLARPLVF